MSEESKDRAVGYWLIVAAGGVGLRFGGEIPKQFQEVSGVPLLQRTLRALARDPFALGMVVVLPTGWAEREITLPGDLGARLPLLVAVGGKRRMDSVRAGLARVPAEAELVLVHDGVRPQVSAELAQRVARGAREHGACVPVLPATETVKEVDSAGRVVQTLERDRLRLVQTPQGFQRGVLEEAFGWAEKHLPEREFCDDASMVEACGREVFTVAGAVDNVKVTVRSDLGKLWPGVPRVGFGYDVHRLVAGRKLMLGGVEIPHELGLLGHSDADVVLHALCDALLGAAALGDIGRWFPDSDPRYSAISSLALLERVGQGLREEGFEPCSLDVTIVAERPKLAPYLPQMSRCIGEALGLSPAAVGVKAKTEEGLGFTGGEQGMAAHAVAVVLRSS